LVVVENPCHLLKLFTLHSNMETSGNIAFILGGSFSAAAAVAHLICIAVGPAAYRLMGAGERMARAAEQGKLHPTLVTLAVSGGLFVWAAVAFSAAGLIEQLPFTKYYLAGISTVYLARAVALPVLKPLFPENSLTFWIVSSGICLVIGIVHAYGLVLKWSVL
jgi:hypothetical protein